MSVPSTVTLAGARQAAPATDLDAVGVARPVASTPARRRRVRRTHVATGLRRLSGVGAAALFWQFAASRGWLGSLLPTPVQVWDAAVQLVRTGQLQTNVAASVERVGKGLAFGLTAGLLLGLLAGLVKAAEDVIDPPLQALRMIPHLALIPVFIVWFGIGETSKVALILIGPLFPIYLNVLHGIRGVDNRLVEAATSFGLGRLAVIRRVILPGALPQIFIGLRQAIGVAWLTLVVAEQSAAPKGIGTLLSDARDSLHMDVIFVLLILYAALGVGTDLFVRLLERRTLRWRQGFAGR